MKILTDAEELGSMEGLSDAELAKLVRDAMGKFRRGRDKDPEAEDDAEDPPADPSSAGHGGRTTATLETQRSRSGNVNPGGATDSAVQATQDAARQVHEARLRQDERDAEAESIIPGYRRL